MTIKYCRILKGCVFSSLIFKFKKTILKTYWMKQFKGAFNLIYGEYDMVEENITITSNNLSIYIITFILFT